MICLLKKHITTFVVVAICFAWNMFVPSFFPSRSLVYEAASPPWHFNFCASCRLWSKMGQWPAVHASAVWRRATTTAWRVHDAGSKSRTQMWQSVSEWSQIFWKWVGERWWKCFMSSRKISSSMWCLSLGYLCRLNVFAPSWSFVVHLVDRNPPQVMSSEITWTPIPTSKHLVMVGSGQGVRSDWRSTLKRLKGTVDEPNFSTWPSIEPYTRSKSVVQLISLFRSQEFPDRICSKKYGFGHDLLWFSPYELPFWCMSRGG